jgi:poly-gamma-glutamate capsule biosynthesis protein CapA/YwtB (metallophosphatase superfamily)
MSVHSVSNGAESRNPASLLNLFLCGDVMLGRGIDQVLPQPGDPCLHEHIVDSALAYVRLADKANGPIPSPVDFAYVWGAALDEWHRVGPDLRIINLETSITQSDIYVPKGINYRMSPGNIDCLLTAKVDCCVLGNNHVLDWGEAGLIETLETLERHRVSTAGAGRDLAEATAPSVHQIVGKGRVLVFSFALGTSGTPSNWAATPNRPGVNYLADLSRTTGDRVVQDIQAVKQPGDVVIASLHWGPNWGYAILEEQRRFAHTLIDRADVSVVHGHSSHHPKAIEVYRNRLILYGCGDFLDDYEGIAGYEMYRSDLVLMYFVRLDPIRGDLLALEMFPLQIRRFRLNRATREDCEWVQHTLHRESLPFNTHVGHGTDDRLTLRWANDGA